MRNPRLCFLSPYAYPLFNPQCTSHFGGAEVQLYQHAKLFASQGYRVDFVVSDFGQPVLEEYGDIYVHKAHRLSGFSNGSGSVFIRLWGMLRLFCVLFTISTDLYVQRCAGFETGIVALVALLKGKPFIYMSAHDIDCNGEYVANNGLRGQWYRWGVHRAQKVLAQSERHRNMLAKTENRVSDVLPTAYGFERLRPHARDYLLWVGRIDEWKQPELFCQLAHALPHYDCVMIGPQNCADEYYQKITERIAHVSNLEYIPFVAFNEIENYFKRASILVNTSRYEGYPNTFVQAMKYGVPIVSLTVNPDAVLTDNKIGFCSQSMRQLSEDIETLQRNPALYEKYAHNCYVYGYNHHRMELIFPKFQAIIEETING